jgi:aspartate kinase
VEGMRNADPKWFNNTIMLDQISYREAIELSYYGASVIHPKTLKPLQNKSIPLRVKSFVDPTAPGTLIFSDIEYDALVPSYIFKPNQVLISISPRDFSFIGEGNLRDIFSVLKELNISINLMQNSALNFSIVIDNDEDKKQKLIDLLSQSFVIKYNIDLRILTIRHYDERTVNALTEGYEILLEQRTRETLRMVLREGA